jgi:hypothetical protein
MEAGNMVSHHQSIHYSRPDPECPRCQGMLVPTLFQVGPFDATVPSFPTAWRCVNCGALLDLQIMMNRSSTPGNSEPSRDQAPQLKARRPRGGPRLRVP